MIRWLSCAAALAVVGCVHEQDHAAVIAQVAGDSHVVVRAEYGRVWWSRCAWSEPHELWALPENSAVEDLRVSRNETGFVVTFHQRGKEWSGTFNPDPTRPTRAAASSDTLAQRDP